MLNGLLIFFTAAYQVENLVKVNPLGLTLTLNNSDKIRSNNTLLLRELLTSIQYSGTSHLTTSINDFIFGQTVSLYLFLQLQLILLILQVEL